MLANNTFRRMKESLLSDEANDAIELLRLRFAGFLDDVTPADDVERQFANFLTSEGVLKKTTQTDYCMASPYVDGYIRTIVLPAKYLNSPTQSPPTQLNSDALHVPEVVVECLNYFDRSVVRLAPSRSFKSSLKLHVNGRSHVQVPRESVYDSELLRLLTNWFTRFGWTISGQWHLRTQSGTHQYTDIVLKKSGKAIVLELLATGDKAFMRSHIDKTPGYKALLSVVERWVIHFTCEDNSTPLWQSDKLSDHVNVIHIAHDLGFTHLKMQTCWKNINNTTQNDIYEIDL